MERSRLRRRSSNNYSVLRAKAITIFNAWIRARDLIRLKGKCYTCGKPGTEAGHFTYGKARFDERAVNLQCGYCNRWLHGNLGAYAIRLTEEYGIETVKELQRLGRAIEPRSKKDLEDIIKKYEQISTTRE